MKTYTKQSSEKRLACVTFQIKSTRLHNYKSRILCERYGFGYVGTCISVFVFAHVVVVLGVCTEKLSGEYKFTCFNKMWFEHILFNNWIYAPHIFKCNTESPQKIKRQPSKEKQI